MDYYILYNHNILIIYNYLIYHNQKIFINLSILVLLLTYQCIFLFMGNIWIIVINFIRIMIMINIVNVWYFLILSYLEKDAIEFIYQFKIILKFSNSPFVYYQ